MSLELPEGDWINIGGVMRFIRKPIQPEPPKKPKRVAKCGTTAGYNKHRRKGEPACLDCLNACRDDQRRRRGVTEVRALQPHGTHAAWSRHRYKKTEPCDECVNAEREYQRERRRADRARAKTNQEDAA